jgi:hypothetical protein
MGYVFQRWMADEFRKAGLKVVEVEGWKNRGRPASTGDYEPDNGVLVHHTGTTTSATSTHPTLRTLIIGRPDLPGPLIPWSVGHDGTVYVIAAGRCNHAGRIDIPVAGGPNGADGNARFMGDEVDTNGTQRLTAAQRHSIAVTNAVYLKHKHLDISRVYRHASITRRKWDIGSITTATLRSDAKTALKGLTRVTTNHVQKGRLLIEEGLAELRQASKKRTAVWAMIRAIGAALKVGPKS